MNHKTTKYFDDREDRDLKNWVAKRVKESNPDYIRKHSWDNNLAYWGKDLYTGYWGTLGVCGQSRDSDVLERANHDAAKSILSEFCQEDDDIWYVENWGHWAVGWIEFITLRLLDHNGLPTEVARYAYENIIEPLEQYPVLDDDLFCEMESEQWYELVEAKMNWAQGDEIDENVEITGELVCQFARAIEDHGDYDTFEPYISKAAFAYAIEALDIGTKPEPDPERNEKPCKGCGKIISDTPLDYCTDCMLSGDNKQLKLDV